MASSTATTPGSGNLPSSPCHYDYFKFDPDLHQTVTQTSPQLISSPEPESYPTSFPHSSAASSVCRHSSLSDMHYYSSILFDDNDFDTPTLTTSLSTDFLLKLLDETIKTEAFRSNSTSQELNKSSSLSSSGGGRMTYVITTTHRSIDTFYPLCLTKISPLLSSKSSPEFASRVQTAGIYNQKHCSNCHTEKSAVWRVSKFSESSGAVLLLCNACGLYEKRTGKWRPLTNVY